MAIMVLRLNSSIVRSVPKKTPPAGFLGKEAAFMRIDSWIKLP